MKVKELIKELSNFPEDMEVVGAFDHYDYPADVCVYTTHYDKKIAEWGCDDDELVVVIGITT